MFFRTIGYQRKNMKKMVLQGAYKDLEWRNLEIVKIFPAASFSLFHSLKQEKRLLLKELPHLHLIQLLFFSSAHCLLSGVLYLFVLFLFCNQFLLNQSVTWHIQGLNNVCLDFLFISIFIFVSEYNKLCLIDFIEN